MFDEHWPSSATLFASDADIDSNMDIVEALEDTRSETFGNPKRMRDIHYWGRNVFQSVYATPRFL